MGNACGTLPQIVYGPQPQKGGKGKVAVSVHWNKHFLRDALSSVSEQSLKSQPFFLLLGLCRTVALSGEASEIQLC